MSLRTRLLVGMAFVAAVLAVVAVVITSTTRNQLIGQIDDRLASFSPGGRWSPYENPAHPANPTTNRPTVGQSVRVTPSRDMSTPTESW